MFFCPVFNTSETLASSVATHTNFFREPVDELLLVLFAGEVLSEHISSLEIIRHAAMKMREVLCTKTNRDQLRVNPTMDGTHALDAGA